MLESKLIVIPFKTFVVSFDVVSITSIVAISENSWTLFSKSLPRGAYIKVILLSVRKFRRIKL